MRDRTPQQRAAKLAEVACQVEVEALEAAATDDDPEPLRTLLQKALARYWDDEAAQAQIAKERRLQRTLRQLAERSEDEIDQWLAA
jgi:hypothetical protein